MIKSMTGFGRGRFENDGKEITVEIKSVNYRYHDINVKIPKNISYLEKYIKKRINEVISRGKVDVVVNYTCFNDSSKEVKINKNLIKNYMDSLNEISAKFNILNNLTLTDILELPEVVNVVEVQDEEEIQNELSQALEEALSSFLKMRINEGEKLAIDLCKRADIISSKIEKISLLSTGLVEEYIVKLKNRIKELLQTDGLDENRIAMETVIYADKVSIEEEITRLKSHIEQLKNMLNEDKPQGKQLDFLVQEMNRETNTIGSKANCLEITQIVILIKNELENIREQIQNIE